MEQTATDKKLVYFRIPEELKRIIQRAAADDGRSLPKQIEWKLKQIYQPHNQKE